MTDPRIPDLIQVLKDHGGDPGDGLHSWRCRSPEKYGPCTCLEELATALLAKLEPVRGYAVMCPGTTLGPWLASFVYDTEQDAVAEAERLTTKHHAWKSTFHAVKVVSCP